MGIRVLPLAVLLTGAVVNLTSSTLSNAPPVVPPAAQPLLAYARAEDAGFSKSALDAARTFADGNGAAAVVALYRGRVIASWGAVDRPFMAHSVRKSLSGALYGIAAASGKLRLDATLADLGIDDEPALTSDERLATVRDLVSARSGVYHPSAYADSGQDTDRPVRGSHPHGSFWFYNNWDFNALESIYQRVTGENVYDGFARRIAQPLGMEDFSAGGQLEVLEPSKSRFVAHTYRISARDLAKFGQLYLQQGRWNGKQIVPASWIRDSWTKHSMTGAREGYGYLWWIYDKGSAGDAYPHLNTVDIYLARGTGGQTIFVVPALEMVVVHRADTDNNRSVRGPMVWQLIERLAAAHTGSGVAKPRLSPVVTERLDNVLPPFVEPALMPLTPEIIARVAGEYGPAGAPATKVFAVGGRLFMTAPGEGEAELFAVAPLSFILRSQPGVKVRFTANASGAVTSAEITIGARTLQAPRRYGRDAGFGS